MRGRDRIVGRELEHERRELDAAAAPTAARDESRARPPTARRGRSAPGTRASSSVRGPRPSSLRAAANSASVPRSSPPPQSPVIGAERREPRLAAVAARRRGSSCRRRTRSATPQPASVPARSTANVSLRTRDRAAPSRGSRASVLERAAPRRGSRRPRAGAAPRPAPRPARARRSAPPTTSSAASTPRWCGELAGAAHRAEHGAVLARRARRRSSSCRRRPRARASPRHLRLEQRGVEQRVDLRDLADERMREQRLARGHRVARDRGLGREPLVRGDVLQRARAARARAAPAAAARRRRRGRAPAPRRRRRRQARRARRRSARRPRAPTPSSRRSDATSPTAASL